MSYQRLYVLYFPFSFLLAITLFCSSSFFLFLVIERTSSSSYFFLLLAFYLKKASGFLFRKGGLYFGLGRWGHINKIITLFIYMVTKFHNCSVYTNNFSLNRFRLFLNWKHLYKTYELGTYIYIRLQKLILLKIPQ